MGANPKNSTSGFGQWQRCLQPKIQTFVYAMFLAFFALVAEEKNKKKWQSRRVESAKYSLPYVTLVMTTSFKGLDED